MTVRAGLALFERRICTPRLSAVVTIIFAAVAPAARCIAAATFCGLRKVTAQMADPLPLKKTPRGPALSAAGVARGQKGNRFFRKRWGKETVKRPCQTSLTRGAK